LQTCNGMKPKLKRVSDQVIVITDAISPIGRATAKLAAKKGACLVLAARDEEELRRVVEEIENYGGHAISVGCDVADLDDVDRVGAVARERFGTFDTWINNASVSIHGKLYEAHMSEKRRLFNVNFWGTVHGCRTALHELKERGGSVINVASMISDRAVPLEGIDSAAKAAVKAYTDALRMELENDGIPVSLTLIKPSPTQLGILPSPAYSPEVIARAILFCAEHPRRDVLVGGGARLFSLMEKFAPRLDDLYLERFVSRERAVSGDRVMGTSFYTYLALRPFVRFAAVGAVGAVATSFYFMRRREKRIPVEKKGRPWNVNMDVHESGMAA